VKVYLAAPLFTTGERMFNDGLAARLRDAGHEVFLPQEQEMSADAPDRNFRNDVAHLEWSDTVIGVVDGPDPDSGTAWEIGYAFATQHPVVLLRTDFRGASATDGPYNLMLARSASVRIDLSIPSLDQAAEAVSEALAKLGARER
jgi:nucleoside 2-deoxyribosyltransferase